MIEQTSEYQKRMQFDPLNKIFIATEYDTLFYVRGFSYPYGWLKASGTPPEPHLDVILLSSAKYNLGDEVPIKIVGCFVRSDADHKLIAILPSRAESDYAELPKVEKADLHRLYPRVGDGEGWVGAWEAKKIIDGFMQRNIGLL